MKVQNTWIVVITSLIIMMSIGAICEAAVKGPHISVAASGADSTVVAGSKSVEIMSVIVTGNGNKDVPFQGLSINVVSDIDLRHFYNFRLYLNDMPLHSINDPDRMVNQGIGEVTFTLPPNGYGEFSGSSYMDFRIKCDISPAINQESFISGLLTSDQVDLGKGIGRVIPHKKVELTGPKISIVPNGILSISSHHASRKNSILAGRTAYEDILNINLTAMFGDIFVDSMPVLIGKLNLGGPDQIRWLTIKTKEGEVLANRIPTTTDNFPANEVPLRHSNSKVYFSRPLIIPQDETVVLEISVTTSQADQYLGSTGESGQGFYIHVPGDEFYAHDVSSGTIIDAIGDVYSADFYLHKSIPILTSNLDSRNPVWGGEIGNRTREPLYAFGVTAALNGSIGIGNFTYTITGTPNIQLSNFELYNSRGLLVGTGYVDEDTIVSTEEFYFVDIVIEFVNDRPLTVLAGAEKTLTLTADVRTNPSNKYPTVQLVIKPKSMIWTDYSWSGPLEEYHPDVLYLPQWYDSELVPEIHGGYFPWEYDQVCFNNR